jgi:CYTH domain-containing protein
VHHINQYYGPTGRLRHVEIFKDGKKSPIEKFIRTNKTTISKGVNEEIESEITKKDFYKELKKCTKHLFKTRYIKKVGKYKWEVDVFDFKIVIAEVEVKTKKELNTVPIPKFIKQELISEITGEKQFSNFNLADKWKLKN